jgi:quercetin dioxygenase-like cupin family protein
MSQPPPPHAPAPPGGPTPATARSLKQRLLERVADAETGHLSIAASQGRWQPWLGGVEIKVLHQAGGLMSYLLRLAPGARLPPHRHRADEECLVLAGVLRVGQRLELGAGGYHLALGGTLHATLSSATGATVFLRGAVPEAGDALA